ncbi:MAG: pyruvate dehydrogenase complex dihydrolipoamide acetyltransferase [Chitinophagaceae bacterium]|jgi:pyruvate dehydrogenase E2 component (dihydrolipoamide acetyltransferase)|nr:pyruvate dehydrogenase complex dihydrolipoamide acetyltransferase [Chitinophagaceae bacterium]OQY95920.1 MAG: pyruvate dehydrogenase complex dihydrolipoamide acetyltransferase [Sphingobacteriales bacterium UTBCD1]
MAEVILMPRLSDTMTEGVIAEWHKKVGDTVKKGDLLADVETDKATLELESYKSGTLLYIGVEKGGKLQVNDLLAIVGTRGEDISSLISGNEKAGDSKKQEPSQQKAAGSEMHTDTTTAVMDISKIEEVVLMPRLSDTMTEGVIAEWHKKVGDMVKKGDVLAEIETDKATLELESYKTGKLLYTGAKKGEKIAVNALLCIIGVEGKVDINAIVNAAKSGSHAEHSNQPPKPAAETKQEIAAASHLVTGTLQTVTENGRIKASPLAKRLAKEKGIDLKKIHGTGDSGRIIKSDIDNYKISETTGQTTGQADLVSAVKPAVPVPQFVATDTEGFTDIPNSQMRGAIAKRLAESKFSAPHFYLTMEINMDNAISARSQLNEVSPVKISFNDMVVKAAALALRQHPAVNASWLGDKIRRYHHIHIGIAVAIEDGLIVPVVRFADQKTLPQISAESKELSGRARTKKLQPNEFTGNTFTISNLGMMDIDEFTAIINPPDSCIMAVGKIKEVVVKKPEGFGVSNFMKITMSCDHRSVDGATGAAFLQTFKKYLENPITMLL